MEQLPDELIVYDTARQKGPLPESSRCLGLAKLQRPEDSRRHFLSSFQKRGDRCRQRNEVWMILHRLSKLNLLVEENRTS